ncbi:MAG TPA: DHH family phosphoesterase [bacterium]|nr:DHH family phosphoesterase [bacterium]HPS29724.1 DHH family phosphoesterase [bacterium]
MAKVKKLIKSLSKYDRVFIQTHNYPDHDSVSSAFALQYLLKDNGIDSNIIYHGEILRDSLQKMIERLKIEIKHHSLYQMDSSDAIVIVDGNKKSRNVAELKGTVVAVIDHHQGTEFPDLEFCDIRSDFGACATIVFSYFAELALEPSVEVATALHTAINFDTHQFTRNVNILDIETVALLYRVSDVNLVNSLVRNSIKIDDLPKYEYLLKNVKFHHNFAYCHFASGCDKNLLAILSDYLMTIDGVQVVVLSAKYLDEIIFSIRSELSEFPAHIMISEALAGIGSGGGHIDMAGGRINNIADFNEAEIFNRFLSELRLRDSFRISGGI